MLGQQANSAYRLLYLLHHHMKFNLKQVAHHAGVPVLALVDILAGRNCFCKVELLKKIAAFYCAAAVYKITPQ